MGSDLYNNLIRYFVTHLKGLKEVRNFPLSNYPLLMGNHSNRTLYKTRLSYDITLASGTDTRRERTTSTDCSLISIATGLNANGMKVEREFILCTQCVIPRLVPCIEHVDMIDPSSYSLRSSNGSQTSSFMYRASMENWLVPSSD